MASETTELTFVRCPSCRSLVPASAARCRICNSPLESSAKSEESDSAKAGSRVRQNTMSADPNEVAAAISNAHAENGQAAASSSTSEAPPVEPPPAAAPVNPPPVMAAPTPAEEPKVDDDQFDPLSAYLEDMDDSESPKAAEASSSDPLGLGALIDDETSSDAGVSLLDELDDDDSWGSPFSEKQNAKPEAAPKVAAEKPATAPPNEVKPPFGASNKEERRAGANPFSRGGEDRRGSAPGFMGKGERDRSPEQRNTEQRHSEQRNTEQKNQEPRPNDTRPQRDRSQPQVNMQGPRKDDRREDRNRDDRPRREERNREERRDDRKETELKGRESRVDDNRNQNARPQERAQRGPDSTKNETAKLFGWLVSYSSPEGKATELRQGRFFVTSSSIKSSDLVIDHESISTPHALMLVHPERGVLVQDLMSEHGVFIRRGNSGEYKQEDGTVPLRHGDWLKFGRVEYLVALLPFAQK